MIELVAMFTLHCRIVTRPTMHVSHAFLVCTCPRNLRPSPGPLEASRCDGKQKVAEAKGMLWGEEAKDMIGPSSAEYLYRI